MTTDTADPLRIERTTRSDGLEVVRQAPPPGTSSFSATYVGPAGFAYDPDGREGIASITGQLLSSGGGRWDRVGLARELDRLGATLTARCDPETTEVTVWGPASTSGKLLDLLAAVVLRPRFGARDLERVRRQALERLLQEDSQPDSRAERELFRTIFPEGHPYRLTGIGTASTVRRIRRSDVVRFHREHFSSADGILLLTGPQSTAEVVRAVRKTFATFPRETSPSRPSLPAGRRGPAEPIRIAMEGRSQVEVLMGGSSLARDDPAYPAGFLANEVLGGRSLLNRLFQRVREANGLAYHASTDLEAMRWGGHWTAQAGTGPERVDRVVAMVTEEVGRMAGEPVGAAELDEIRESSIGQIPLMLETTSGAHELGLDLAYHRLPDDFYRNWPATLRALTAADVRRGAEVAFDRTASATVVAGPTS